MVNRRHYPITKPGSPIDTVTNRHPDAVCKVTHKKGARYSVFVSRKDKTVLGVGQSGFEAWRNAAAKL